MPWVFYYYYYYIWAEYKTTDLNSVFRLIDYNSAQHPNIFVALSLVDSRQMRNSGR